MSKLSIIKVVAAGALLSGLGMVTAGVTGPVQHDLRAGPHVEGNNQPIQHLRQLPFRIQSNDGDYVSNYIKKKETTYYENISQEKITTSKLSTIISQNIMRRFPAESLLQGSKSSTPNKMQTVSIASSSTKKHSDQLPSFSHPVKNPSLTSTFGMRNGYHHNGIDVVSQTSNLEIRAAKTGKVVTSRLHSGGLGNLVIIDHGNGFETYYGHLSKRFVSEGDTVRAGDIIGKMGSTGNSTGVHLHFEIRKNNQPLNPLAFLKSS